MRRLWNGLVFTSALLLVLAGCAGPDHLKPPKQPESFNSPPDEARFDRPIEYPRKVLMEDKNKDYDPTNPDQFQKKTAGPGSMRAGGGGGGPGF
jgi:hypothetical protein